MEVWRERTLEVGVEVHHSTKPDMRCVVGLPMSSHELSVIYLLTLSLLCRAPPPPPARSVDTLSVKELYSLKHETTNRALNAKMLTSLFEKPECTPVQVKCDDIHGVC